MKGLKGLATLRMLTNLLLRLDKRRWPQRFVSWVLNRRARSKLSQYLFPRSTATNAVCLSVASPLVAAKDLIGGAVPVTFGSWSDYRVLEVAVSGHIAVAILREMRSGVEFSLIVPRHPGFKKRQFKELHTVRLTCEAERSALVTVRHPDGRLIAAGTLELIPRAAFSKEILS